MCFSNRSVLSNVMPKSFSSLLSFIVDPCCCKYTQTETSRLVAIYHTFSKLLFGSKTDLFFFSDYKPFMLLTLDTTLNCVNCLIASRVKRNLVYFI